METGVRVEEALQRQCSRAGRARVGISLESDSFVFVARQRLEDVVALGYACREEVAVVRAVEETEYIDGGGTFVRSSPGRAFIVITGLCGQDLVFFHSTGRIEMILGGRIKESIDRI